METSGVSSLSYAGGTSGLKGQQVMTEISVAVMKQQQEQEQRMAASLIGMINQTPRPSLEGTGQIIDVFA